MKFSIKGFFTFCAVKSDLKGLSFPSNWIEILMLQLLKLLLRKLGLATTA